MINVTFTLSLSKDEIETIINALDFQEHDIGGLYEDVYSSESSSYSSSPALLLRQKLEKFLNHRIEY